MAKAFSNKWGSCSISKSFLSYVFKLFICCKVVHGYKWSFCHILQEWQFLLDSALNIIVLLKEAPVLQYNKRGSIIFFQFLHSVCDLEKSCLTSLEGRCLISNMQILTLYLNENRSLLRWATVLSYLSPPLKHSPSHGYLNLSERIPPTSSVPSGSPML